MEKYQCLIDWFEPFDEVTVAYSGGMDSTLLAYAAYEALGSKASAVTFNTDFQCDLEISNAKKTAKQIGINHKVMKLSTLDIKNDQLRCYNCKKKLFNNLKGDVLEGTKLDDDPERPGFRAVKELKVKSPLLDCGITREDVEAISQHLGLPHHPSNSCLATRIAGKITKEQLAQVEKMEEYLHSKGINDVRARHQGKVMRIEVKPNLFSKLEENADGLLRLAISIGFENIEFGLR